MIEQRGLVISYFGHTVAVESEQGQIIHCQLHRNQTLPVVGDIVWWQASQAETGTILRIEPRRNQLTRQKGKGKPQPLAANLDDVLIVMAPAPIFSEYLIDRYLLAATLLHLHAALILNKIDLLSESELEKTKAQLAPYQAIGYPVIMTSMKTGAGLADLKHLLQSRSSVLVGPSGVGKSSIIHQLVKSEDIRIREVSDKGAGKHTTTATRLYHLPDGGSLIDSPGVREFNLWEVTPAEVLQGFKEFTPFIHQCKFRNCQHLVEPGCAVQAAVANGKISAARYANFQQLTKIANQVKKYD